MVAHASCLAWYFLWGQVIGCRRDSVVRTCAVSLLRVSSLASVLNDLGLWGVWGSARLGALRLRLCIVAIIRWVGLRQLIEVLSDCWMLVGSLAMRVVTLLRLLKWVSRDVVAPLLTFPILGSLLDVLLCSIVKLMHVVLLMLHPDCSSVLLICLRCDIFCVMHSIWMLCVLLMSRNRLWLFAIMLIGLGVLAVSAVSMLLVLHFGVLMMVTFRVLSMLWTSGIRVLSVVGIRLMRLHVIWRVPQAGISVICYVGC